MAVNTSGATRRGRTGSPHLAIGAASDRSQNAITTSRQRCIPSQAEYVEHGGRRLVLQLGRVLDNERPHARSNQNGNVLLAVHRIADWRSLNWAADVEAP